LFGITNVGINFKLWIDVKDTEQKKCYLKLIGGGWSSRTFGTHGLATDQPQEKKAFRG